MAKRISSVFCALQQSGAGVMAREALRRRRGLGWQQVDHVVRNGKTEVRAGFETVEISGLVRLRDVQFTADDLQCEPQRLNGIDPEDSAHMAAAETFDLVRAPAVVRRLGGRDRKPDADDHGAVGTEREATL